MSGSQPTRVAAELIGKSVGSPVSSGGNEGDDPDHGDSGDDKGRERVTGTAAPPRIGGERVKGFGAPIPKLMFGGRASPYLG